MAIDPENAANRVRLSRAVDESFRELRHYSRLRDITIKAYLGATPANTGPEWAKTTGWGRTGNSKYLRSLPKGNLLQSAGLGLQVSLAYGEPQFLFKARMPEHIGLAEKLTAGVNRMVTLLNAGDTARNVAADSYFGYGIFKVGVGRLPISARATTGLTIGPNIWRVGQNDLVYDIHANDWRNGMSYIGDMYTNPLDDAIEMYPDHADRLIALTDTERLDARHVLPRQSNLTSAEDEVRLIDLFFQDAGVVATWPIRGDSFGELANEPLAVREYDGHWSGIYEILNHLYSPDELVPIAQAESVKSFHFLFNDLMELTSQQALSAKINPMFRKGNDADMQKLWDAKDRVPVSQTQLSPQGQQFFEIPGPSQNQTAFMSAMFNFFKEFTPTFDEPARAPTATQGALERQTTNAIIGEARRKFNRSLQLVGYKLGHLLMKSQDLVLPSSRPLRPGSDVSVDVSFLPAQDDPRVATIDDFDISVDPYSTQFRSPQERLQQLFAINQQIVSMMQLKASGAPINVEKVISTLSEYSGLPEIKEWYEEVDPLFQVQQQQGNANTPRVGIGQYTRENVSTQTNGGAIQQNLEQMGGQNSSIQTQTQQG